MSSDPSHLNLRFGRGTFPEISPMTAPAILLTCGVPVPYAGTSFHDLDYMNPHRVLCDLLSHSSVRAMAASSAATRSASSITGHSHSGACLWRESTRRCSRCV